MGLAYSHVDIDAPTVNAYFSSDGGSTQPNGRNWQAWKLDNVEVNARYRFTHTSTQAHFSSTVGRFNPKSHQLSSRLNYEDA
ncbi:hypothetical protein [Paraburkholderia bannensis]|uniref:hypothetical protein n=1 Tax=Paraburkholderia bannensis TaxID=765414 RepID=UPI002AB6567C|nr:hypothetical protein [Paraburkholderia bannensis]